MTTGFNLAHWETGSCHIKIVRLIISINWIQAHPNKRVRIITHGELAETNLSHFWLVGLMRSAAIISSLSALIQAAADNRSLDDCINDYLVNYFAVNDWSTVTGSNTTNEYSQLGTDQWPCNDQRLTAIVSLWMSQLTFEPRSTAQCAVHCAALLLFNLPLSAADFDRPWSLQSSSFVCLSVTLLLCPQFLNGSIVCAEILGAYSGWSNELQVYFRFSKFEKKFPHIFILTHFPTHFSHNAW